MARSLAVLLGLFLAACVCSAEEGLLLHYTFDEGSGSAVKDVSGNGHDGAIKGATYVKSPRGFALSFDGVDDIVDFGNKPSMILAGDLTLMIWVKTNASESPRKHRVIFGDASKAVDRNLNLRINHANKLIFEWGDGATNASFASDSAMLDGTWKHLTIVADSKAALITLYVNAHAYAQMKMPLPISKTKFSSRFIGSWGYGAFKGEVDDIRLYNRALPEAEIERICASEAVAAQESAAAGAQGAAIEILNTGRLDHSDLPSPLQVGPACIALDTAAERLQGAVCLPIGNRTGRPMNVRIAAFTDDIGGPAAAMKTVVLPPDGVVEVGLGRMELQPLFAKRTDFFLTRSRPTIRRAVVSAPEDPQIRSRVFVLGAMQGCEPVRIEVADPWKRDLAPGKTGRIEVVVHAAILQKAQGEMVIALTSRENSKVVAEQRNKGAGTTTPAAFETKDIPWGAYDVCAAWRDAGGREVVAAQALATVLPGEKEFIKPLNNLVTELMNARQRGLLGNKEIGFMNPRDGWCFFSIAGDTTVKLDDAAPPLASARAGERPAEAMRLLPAGKHVLHIEGQPSDIIARSVPALIYNVHEATPQIAAFGTHTWERLKRTMLPHCNMIEGQQKEYPEMAEWRAAGKLWVTHVQTPGLFDMSVPVTAEQAYQAWKENISYANPAFDGMQADEMVPSYSPESFYAFTESVGRLHDDPKFAGRLFVPFVVRPHIVEGGPLFLKAILAAGWPYSIELYLPEQPTEEADRENIQNYLVKPAREYDDAMPGSLRRAIIAPMYSELPHCTTNGCPSVDFKVHLEMQVHALATDPLFFGLYGVQPYRSNYCDEETLRWMGKLLRHYCIEGRTDRPWNYPYILPHLKNPDFEEGISAWDAEPAQKDGIAAKKFSGYGALEGRYPPSERGDAFAVLKRSATGPNVLGQEVKALEPGRLYSLKVITADYQDLLGGKSRKAPNAVSIKLDGAEMLPGSFQYTFRNERGPKGFTKQSPFWMNYHWLQFRAKAPTARLTITDWKDEKDPGGPVGQEVMINFVELQPVAEQ